MHILFMHCVTEHNGNHKITTMVITFSKIIHIYIECYIRNYKINVYKNTIEYL